MARVYLPQADGEVIIRRDGSHGAATYPVVDHVADVDPADIPDLLRVVPQGYIVEDAPTTATAPSSATVQTPQTGTVDRSTSVTTGSDVLRG